MLVTSIFSFSHYFSYPFKNKFQIFHNIYMYFAICKINAFNSDQSKTLLFGKDFNENHGRTLVMESIL